MGVSDISADAGRASPSRWGANTGQVLGSTVEGRCFQSGCWENTEDVGRTLKNKEIRIMYKYFRLCGKPRKGNRK